MFWLVLFGCAGGRRVVFCTAYGLVVCGGETHLSQSVLVSEVFVIVVRCSRLVHVFTPRGGSVREFGRSV